MLTNHTLTDGFCQINRFFLDVFSIHWKRKKKTLVVLDPKPLETASFALNGIIQTCTKAVEPHAPTWTHMGQEQPSFTSLL